MKRLLGLLGLGAGFVALGVVLAVIVLPDSDSVPDNVISSEQELVIDLSVSPASALLTGVDMQPGDIVSGTLVLTNNEAFPVYSDLTIAVTGDAALASALVLGVKVGSPCSDGDLLLADGTVHPMATPLGYFGPYQTGATLISNQSVPSSRNVCFQVVLPSGVDLSTVSGQTTTSIITIDTDDTP